MKKFIKKFLIIIVLIFILIFIGIFSFRKYQRYSFKKILVDNDATNYELIETVNDSVITVKVKDRVLLSTEDEIITWVNELEKRRIVVDEEYKTALITENDSELKVNSLNYTYINDYFENSNQKFKYLGEKDGYYIVEFTEKATKNKSILYINKDTKIVDKFEQVLDGYDFTREFEGNKNSVSNLEVEEPNIDNYRIYDSVSSN